MSDIDLCQKLFVLYLLLTDIALYCTHDSFTIVAVAGLPDPMKDHALAITRFARDCLSVFHPLTRKLDVVLGPDTSDLSLRIGLHSGPVTAGVLRGDRARFQLYVVFYVYVPKIKTRIVSLSHALVCLLFV